MNISNILHSEQDKSVNFVFDNWLEARFVRRTQDYFIVYLSSHTGCNKACRFCHLTQTGQTSFDEASLQDYVQQAKAVLEYYDSIKKEQGAAVRVNFNFMARGEPLANSVILNNSKQLFSELEDLATERNLVAQFNISSIMPYEIENLSLEDVFKDVSQNYTIYYSLYSTNPQFRKRWLPKAISVESALNKLQQWQQHSNKPLAFHWAFIEGQNDDENDINEFINTIKPYNFQAKFNLVRYNPYSESQGKEPAEQVLQRNFDKINLYLENPLSRIVPRVGFDVKASCGMFVNKD